MADRGKTKGRTGFRALAGVHRNCTTGYTCPKPEGRKVMRVYSAGFVANRVLFFPAQRWDRNRLDLKLETELRELNGTRKGQAAGRKESKK